VSQIESLMGLVHAEGRSRVNNPQQTIVLSTLDPSLAGSRRIDVPPLRRITTLDDLREHLQWAIELEHFTLPPYLCALYSLDPARNPEATEALSGVLIEEMLHMTLAANLLNAVAWSPTDRHP
jgi:hypothetical protein